MASTTQLKIGAGALWIAGLATLVAALLLRQPLLLPVGAVLIGVGRTAMTRILRRTLPR
ncbi:hypothetical protein SAMN05428989_2812 [Pseudoxanthomonas sp. GM95]|uniref:hypothetical protein n=1 Tax=Pseudoxanthomonas sp. GM95 TaxID=1881043 RepID=UPI0008B7CF09|nr:hypothetical protein [Pseudoxanthomonas sp. GM95]SEL89550.1 hypothetical protein SAMN05428989_2812 [Pseudoxanthomonas sp. GM95]